MPSAKIKFIISSSESEAGYAADNLLQGPSKRTKWKGKAGADSNVVVLQLERQQEFTSVDIGNENSALIEILVARSSDDQQAFHTLVPSTSFMNPMESRSAKNGNRVRVFTELEMVTATAKQKWDIVKIICTQPFNRKIPYGLSFVNIAVDNVNEVKKPKHILPKISLKLKDTTDDPKLSLSAGEMFKRRETFSSTLDDMPSTSGLSAPERAPVPKPAKKRKEGSHRKNADEENLEPASSAPQKKRVKKNELPEQEDDGKQVLSTNISNVPQPSTSSATASAAKRNDEDAAANKTGDESAKPFEKLLEDVRFSLSGYLNPLRSVLREKAMDMGAKYRADWTPDCTHLVCAFPNTPKYRQVYSKSTIVTGKWIEMCYLRKKRLPEKSFPCR